MKTTIKLKLSQGRITEVKLQSDDYYEFVVDSKEPIEAKVEVVSKTENAQDNLIFIEASRLSLEDKFMKHKPKTEEEKEFKKLLEEVIKKGVKDFWRPRIDPSFNKDKSGIFYIPGSKPAVGMSYNWWKKALSEYNSKCGSRLGTKSEYVAFLGILIKRLISEGSTVENAWNAVCNDSRQLGHYGNSKGAKNDFEPTGSREVCGLFDLANTYKILAEDKEVGGFWLAGGIYNSDGDDYPLADLYRFNNLNYDCNDSVGWLVLEKGSADH